MREEKGMHKQMQTKLQVPAAIESVSEPEVEAESLDNTDEEEEEPEEIKKRGSSEDIREALQIMYELKAIKITLDKVVKKQEKMDKKHRTKDNHEVGWYKQTPGTGPQLVLYHHHWWSRPNYGPGFGSDRFTSTIDSAGIVYHLIIKNVEMSDAALYYCGKWVSSINNVVFGPGTKLFVAVQYILDPSVKLLGPSAEEISAKESGTLVCLVSKLSMGFPVVSWTVNGSPTSSEVQTSGVTQNADKTFSLSSYLTVPGADWSSGKRYSCSVQQGAASTISATVTQSSC
ncbi:immunoglobulin lambda-1 light chain-like [Hypanus sabinus]|uniref:immunoglobulin lambda-1 light chain-like n=1 Tax=Hypanus sabinus TaxID=79690 RepID=UPI0028C38CBF|nr:immunoglobulin lambda-1 light chain-like [Hypanus sabinus]